jgi:type II secretory ATPase GspE/PulE/Tfp pilus assembly ATPase PilB-like protein
MIGLSEFQERIKSLENADPPDVVALADCILGTGIELGASDIHIEPQAHGLTVRLRLAGVLYEAGCIKREVQSQLVSRIKVLSDLLTYKTDVPQEGRIKAEKLQEGIDLRVATFPTIYGERALVRIFTKEKGAYELEDLGFDEALLEILRKHLHSNKGVILLTGPAGSGKTTTIYSCLKEIMRTSPIKRHILTIEDPVECAIEGATQTQINPAADLTFAKALRSMLRGDPEVLMVGEIRDPETAHIAVEAGLTGHLVITTIHSGTACGVFSRLLEMGVEPYLLTSSASLVLAQRLLRTLCPSCKRETQAPEEMRDAIEGNVYSAGGCQVCAGTGYSGRTAVAEVLELSSDIKKAILARSDVEGIEKAARSLQAGKCAYPFRTMKEKAMEKVRGGITSLEEVKRIFPF